MVKNYKNEYRIFGPPGTGKTTFLKSQISKAIVTHTPNKIYVCSFTKAAALNLLDRGVAVPPENVGTIHALCYRLLGSPRIATDSIKEEFLANEKSAKMTNNKIDLDDPYSMEGSKDLGILTEIDLLRNKLLPLDHSKQKIFDRWNKFKEENELLDFTDLLEQGLEYELPNAEIIFVDEAQDLVPLHWKIVRKWSENCERLVLAGDDDQTLYEWAGASAKLFIPPSDFPKDHIRTLKQSYRVPKLIHRLAEEISSRIESRFQGKIYNPLEHKGTLTHFEKGDHTHPEDIVSHIKSYLYNNKQKSIMLLASCGYMLSPTLKRLRAEGIPYCNNYRPKRGDWNPLKLKSEDKKMISTLSRFATYAQDAYSGHRWGNLDRFGNWYRMILTKYREYNDKAFDNQVTWLKNEFGADFQLDDEWLKEFFKPEVHDIILNRDLNRFVELTYKKFHSPLAYYANIYKNKMFHEVENPRLTVGTIHSVKGGEADCVFLYPDLSPQSMIDESQGQQDNIHRLMYVGVTRTKDELCFLPGKNENSYKF